MKQATHVMVQKVDEDSLDSGDSSTDPCVDRSTDSGTFLLFPLSEGRAFWAGFPL